MGKSRYKRKYPSVQFDFFAQYSSIFSKTPEILISDEIERIHQAKEDHKLFAASFSLARLYQVQYRNGKKKNEIHDINMNLLTDENKEILLAINNITDPILRIIVTSTILDMKHPSIFNDNQSHLLRIEIIELLNRFLPTSSLLISTLLFVRCQSICRIFSSNFQQFANNIGEQLIAISVDEEIGQNQRAAYIALKMIDNSLLIPYLTEFENVGDLLEMNSIIFHHYFTENTLFTNSDHVVLSLMYLSELAVDAQSLKHNMNFDDQNETSSIEKLWQLFMKSENVITFEIANLIKDCMGTCNKEDLAMITKRIFSCYTILTNARPVVFECFNWQINESIKPLIYYVALLLVKDDFKTTTLINRIDELHLMNIDERFKNIIRDFLELESIDLMVLDKVLVPLIQNVHRSSLCTGAVVRCQKTMKAILKLEHERLSTGAIDSESFLSLLDGCSLNIQIYLSEHFLEVINTDSEIENTIKEEYLASIISWIIQDFAFQTCIISNILYDSIISFLYNRQFPNVQQAIIISIKNLFMKMTEENIFTNENVKILLENLIKHYNTKQQDVYSESLLAASINAYGYYLRFSKKYYPNQNLSNEMLNLLINLFEASSSSEVIIARVGQCLLMIELYVHNGSVSNWLNRKHLTSEQIYNAYTRCTFDERDFLGNRYSEDPLVSVLLKNSTNFFRKFIDELYKNLQKISSNCNVHDETLNYIDTAVRLCRENLDLFRTAMNYCSFNEQQFKTMLYQASQKGNNRFRQHCVQLYRHFGDLTPELIDMILNTKHGSLKGLSSQDIDGLINMKQILLNRTTIEKLYQALELPFQQIHAMELLKHLAHIDIVSTLEVNEQISEIIKKLSSDDPYYLQHNYRPFFNTLLELSCMAADNNYSLVPHKESNDSQTYSKILNDRDICMAFERLK